MSFTSTLAQTEKHDDPAIAGLQASLQTSESLGEIFRFAQRRYEAGGIDEERYERIRSICRNYEKHHKDVRDHCLDICSLSQEIAENPPPSVELKTHFLMTRGRRLLKELAQVATG